MNDWPAWFRALNEARAQARRDLDLEQRLQRARELIDRSFDQPLDVDRMAKEAAFSRYHFMRAFRRTYEETPHQYLTRRRIERARELLLTTDRPVTDICLDVGYCSLGSFSSLFQRHMGYSPTRYRRRLVQSPGVPVPRIPSCFLSMFR